MRSYWTITLDDALCERFTRCICCREQRGQARLDAFVVQGRVMTLTRCHRCAATDPEARRLLARLAQREGEPR